MEKNTLDFIVALSTVNGDIAQEQVKRYIDTIDQINLISGILSVGVNTSDYGQLAHALMLLKSALMERNV